jgi:mxaA protein
MFAISRFLGLSCVLAARRCWSLPGKSRLRTCVRLPAQQERAEDYLRPDSAASLVDEARPKALAVGLAALAVLSIIVLAWDRGWPPFHRRPARVFGAVARDLARQARGTRDATAFYRALRRVHPSIDATNGASLLAEDLPSFLTRRSEFAPLRSSFERFFAASNSRFIGDQAEAAVEDEFSELLRFVQALSRVEKTR